MKVIVSLLVVALIAAAAYFGYCYAERTLELEIVIKEVPGPVVTVQVPGSQEVKIVEVGPPLPEVVSIETERVVTITEIEESPYYAGPREYESLEELREWLATYEPFILSTQLGDTIIELETRQYGDADFAFAMATTAHEQGYFMMMLVDRGRCLTRIGGRYYEIDPQYKGIEWLTPKEAPEEGD